MKKLIVLALAVFAASPAQAVDFTAAGYTQNFDALGTGTSFSPISGWSVLTLSGSHDTWNATTGINTVASMVNGNQTIRSGTTKVTGQTGGSFKDGDQAYNLAYPTSTSDRVLSTSPTSVTGVALQLSLTNNTGSAINVLDVSYDIVKFFDGDNSNTGYANKYEELPGYQLFYQIGNGAWANVSALNPVRTADGSHPVVPVGTVSNPGTWDYNVTAIDDYLLTLNTAWTAGQTLNLRWVDDNCQPFSADQIIGLNNVEINAVPVPAAAWLLGSGLLGLVGLRRRAG